MIFQLIEEIQFKNVAQVFCMKDSIIIYSTIDGQTKKICEKIISTSYQNKSIDMCSVEDVTTFNLNDYSKIIVGASIRYGKHSPKIYQFVDNNIGILREKFTAFFTVNVVARKKNKNTPETNPYMKKFLELSNWEPTILGVFAGRIDYPSYKFIDKQMIRLIMFITKGPTDTSREYEFTDWDEVEKFSKLIHQK